MHQNAEGEGNRKREGNEGKGKVRGRGKKERGGPRQYLKCVDANGESGKRVERRLAI